MRLRPDFESVRSQLLNRDPIPSFDDVVHSVISEETRLSTLSTFRPSTVDTVLATAAARQSGAPPSTASRGVPLLPAPLTQAVSPTASPVICHYCKRPGHMKAQCRKLQQRQQQQPRSQQRSSGASHPLAASATASVPETSTDLASQMAQITEQLHAM